MTPQPRFGTDPRLISATGGEQIKQSAKWSIREIQDAEIQPYSLRTISEVAPLLNVPVFLPLKGFLGQEGGYALVVPPEFSEVEEPVIVEFGYKGDAKAAFTLNELNTELAETAKKPPILRGLHTSWYGTLIQRLERKSREQPKLKGEGILMSLTRIFRKREDTLATQVANDAATCLSAAARNTITLARILPYLARLDGLRGAPLYMIDDLPQNLYTIATNILHSNNGAYLNATNYLIKLAPELETNLRNLYSQLRLNWNSIKAQTSAWPPDQDITITQSPVHPKARAAADVLVIAEKSGITSNQDLIKFFEYLTRFLIS